METSFVQTESTDVRVPTLDEMHEVGTVDILDADADTFVVTLIAESGNAEPFVVSVDGTEQKHWLQSGQERHVFTDSFTLFAKAGASDEDVTYRVIVREEGSNGSDDVEFTVRS